MPLLRLHLPVVRDPVFGSATDGQSAPIATAQMLLGIQPALRELRLAYQESRLLNKSPWDFAIELRSLRTLGFSATALRVLTSAGYTEHAAETTNFRNQNRSFRSTRERIVPRTCVILTSVGFTLAKRAARLETRCPGAPADTIDQAALEQRHADPFVRWQARQAISWPNWLPGVSPGGLAGAAMAADHHGSAPSRRKGGPQASSARCQKTSKPEPGSPLDSLFRDRHRHRGPLGSGVLSFFVAPIAPPAQGLQSGAGSITVD